VRIECSFEVPAAADELWTLLMDVPRVVPCMPGAELIETVDESTWKTKMSVHSRREVRGSGRDGAEGTPVRGRPASCEGEAGPGRRSSRH
jgi:carbon monoxide dehydrogenase subunit G